jgi:hypothetical protein
MAILNLNNEDITELLTLLNSALTDVNAQIHSSTDDETRKLFEEHRERIKMWIHRLSRLEYEEERFRLDSEQ